jgi:D-glycero-D-manno-heptose 1,7-bisphosphate phosphatase
MRAVFLDRDGVINSLIYHEDMGIVDSPFTLAQFKVLPGVPKAIRRLNDLGVFVVVVSNQPGVAKHHFSLTMLDKFGEKLRTTLGTAGARIDATYYCLHHPQAVVRKYRRRCSCRKPSPGMLLRAARDLGVSLQHSYMVGDGLTDIEAGSRAGCTTIYVGRWKCENCQFIRPRTLRPDWVAKDLGEAVQLIAADVRGSSEAAVTRVRATPIETEMV